jgi:hypothetical protein
MTKAILMSYWKNQALLQAREAGSTEGGCREAEGFSFARGILKALITQACPGLYSLHS